MKGIDDKAYGQTQSIIAALLPRCFKGPTCLQRQYVIDKFKTSFQSRFDNRVFLGSGYGVCKMFRNGSTACVLLSRHGFVQQQIYGCLPQRSLVLGKMFLTNPCRVNNWFPARGLVTLVENFQHLDNHHKYLAQEIMRVLLHASAMTVSMRELSRNEKLS